MPGRFLPGMLLLFVGSGCAALIYEVVWFQMLQFVVGASGISLGVLLGTFMGGMFLGSLALPRFIPIDRHPLLVYAVIEALIGVIGLSLLWVIPWVGTAYANFVSPGLASIIARTLLTALVLLPPTILMGATLPAIARYVETTPKGVSWMGFFYGGNIAGAVLGSLLAGFYLLRVYDIPTAAAAAAFINFAVASIAYVMSKVSDHRPQVNEQARTAPVFARRSRVISGALALSGLTALGGAGRAGCSGGACGAGYSERRRAGGRSAWPGAGRRGGWGARPARAWRGLWTIPAARSACARAW